MGILLRASNPKLRTVDLTLDINDLHDIVNGLHILIGTKEHEITKYGGDSQDKTQLARYQKVLGEIQQVKGLIK